MSNETFQVIQIIIGILVGAGAIITALGYAYGKFSEGRDNVLRADNADLRESREDQDRKISELQKDVAHLQGQIKVLTDKSIGYERLIMSALENFLETNPQIAKELYKRKDQVV